MENEAVLAVLLGLAGACENNPKTEDTDALVVKALGAAPEQEEAMIAALRREKDRISPGCAQCPCPCGNTSDYDLGRFAQLPPALGAAKWRLLSGLREMAQTGQLTPERMDRVYQALGCVRYGEDPAALDQALAALTED